MSLQQLRFWLQSLFSAGVAYGRLVPKDTQLTVEMALGIKDEAISRVVDAAIDGKAHD